MIVFCHLLNDRSGSPTVLRNTLDVFDGGLLFVGSQGRGVLEEAGVPTRRYWYRRSRHRIVTLFTYFASQAALYRALARSRDIPTDAIVFVNTLLPFAAMLWGRRTGRRVVVHLHEVSITPGPLRRFLTRCAARSADLLLYVSNDHRARLPIEGPRARIVPNPVSPDLAARADKHGAQQDGMFRVLMLASLRGYKGVEEFISLAEGLRARADISFDLVLNAEAEDVATFSARYSDVVPYDALSLWQAVRSGHDRILLLGVSGALALPLIRLISRARVITNIDGIEWKREKWTGLARLILRASEWAAVRFSHEVIADNEAIADHVRKTYGSGCHVVAYGGDNALAPTDPAKAPASLPKRYALALCRIEPENNVHVILEAFHGLNTPLVFVGNWDNSGFGRGLKAQYGNRSNLYLLDPIYEASTLHALRARASVYVHGHSAGGTNPSLVEMMHFGIPVLAHGCAFNRHSTEGKARYFETATELAEHLDGLNPEEAAHIGADMREIAQRRYTWDQIGEAYFTLIEGDE